MAIKKTELYSSLWASADELRGGMDASEYKNYVLTLLFMKYVSDKVDDPKSLIDIPDGASFSDMVALAGDKEIGDKINKIISKLAEANGLKGIIDTADFNDNTKLGSDKEMVDRLSRLIRIFDTLDLGSNNADDDDLLGDAYEYLMRHFATESGKSKGQFYTPSEVSTILPKVIGIDKNTTQDQTVYDPTCGSGSLLLKATSEAPNGLSIYGQEKEVATTALCRMNMILHDNAEAEIAVGGQSTLAVPAFVDKSDNKLKTFDFVVANPPFSLKAWTSGVDSPDIYERFEGFATPPEKNGDYAFLLHMVKSLKSKGKAAVILPHGVLFRGNTEGSIRTKLIKKGYIKGIIGLPANLFYGTGIPACIIILDKENASARTGIFMIDASKGFKKDGNKNRLRDQDVHKIVDTFNNTNEVEKYSRMVTLSEIETNEYNLNIPRYIDSSEIEDLHDLTAHLNGGIPNYDIENLNSFWEVFPSMKNDLFKENVKDGYSDIKVESTKIKQTILDSIEFKKFKDETMKKYMSWKDRHDAVFYNLDVGVSSKSFIHSLAEDLLNSFSDTKLIEKYDIYQILKDYWSDILQDDIYLISQDGWAAGNDVRELVPTKDKKGKNIYRESHDFEIKSKRYKADLIPPYLIIDSYFLKEKNEIDELQNRADTIAGELESFIELNSGENGLLEDARNEKENINKASVAKRLKESNDVEEIEILKQCKKLFEDDVKAKKVLKDAQILLNLLVFKKYPALNIDEIKVLIIEDKWHKYLLESIRDEIERVTQTLSNRVKILDDRYRESLPHLDNEVKELSDKVEKHLKSMGLSW